MNNYNIVSEPFSWNDNFSELAQEDFSDIRKNLNYCTCQSIGLALAKLELIENGKLILDNKGKWIMSDENIRALEIMINESSGYGEKTIYTEEEIHKAYDIAISAIDKQILKKVVDKSLVEDNGIAVGFVGKCPSCGEIIDETTSVCDCGQKLDWSDNN